MMKAIIWHLLVLHGKSIRESWLLLKEIKLKHCIWLLVVGIVVVVDASVNSDLRYHRHGIWARLEWKCFFKEKNIRGMKVFLWKGKLLGFKSIKHILCDSCIFSEHKRIKFSKVGRESKIEKLELVQRASLITSLKDSSCYVTFINDLSIKVWVYFFKNKYNIFNTFKKWRVMVEVEFNSKVKCLLSNNGW